ncbi:MAG TPA: gluconokinase [Streptosporangiaceae bacterium]|nr:gluconokinase [Streptosporangiaceae bacterium]
MILIIAGVAGCGKTTVGKVIASRLNWTFADADDMHPEANIAKMRAGQPLTDEDREPWLQAIDAWLDARIRDGQNAVLACSALRRSYRNQMLEARPQVDMCFLAVSREADEKRMQARKGHFFGESLLASQFAALEVPKDEERVYVVDPGRRSPGELADAIIKEAGLG